MVGNAAGSALCIVCGSPRFVAALEADDFAASTTETSPTRVHGGHQAEAWRRLDDLRAGAALLRQRQRPPRLQHAAQHSEQIQTSAVSLLLWLRHTQLARKPQVILEDGKSCTGHADRHAW